MESADPATPSIADLTNAERQLESAFARLSASETHDATAGTVVAGMVLEVQHRPHPCMLGTMHAWYSQWASACWFGPWCARFWDGPIPPPGVSRADGPVLCDVESFNLFIPGHLLSGMAC